MRRPLKTVEEIERAIAALRVGGAREFGPTVLDRRLTQMMNELEEVRARGPQGTPAGEHRRKRKHGAPVEPAWELPLQTEGGGKVIVKGGDLSYRKLKDVNGYE